MSFWNGIINSATLGSAKLPLKVDDLPTPLTNSVEVLQNPDPEENFLRLVSLAYQYRQSGAKPLDLSSFPLYSAGEESLPYSSDQASAVFKTIFDEELYPLLNLWLERCESKRLLASPELIPELLDIATRRKELRKNIFAVCGKRGEWLSKLNPDWDLFAVVNDVDTVWQTGSPEERKNLLRDLRISNAAKSIEVLQSTWGSEGANEKAAFLEILRINLSGDDLFWLESLKEKGQKVNNIILELLKAIPASAIVQQYWAIVKEAVTLKSGKALLGMISKTIVDVNENLSIPDLIFKTGIEKLSSNKNVSDNQHILVQLIASVPPSLWNAHFNDNNKAVITLFQKEKKSAIYLPAVALASIRFNDLQWIKDLIDHSDSDLMDSSIVLLIRALPETERRPYLLKYIKEKPNELVQLVSEHDGEWGIDLAREVLKVTAREVYAYNRTFYKAVVPLIPVGILSELDSFIPSEEQKKPYWKTQSDELTRLLEIKKQIIQSF